MTTPSLPSPDPWPAYPPLEYIKLKDLSYARQRGTYAGHHTIYPWRGYLGFQVMGMIEGFFGV